MESNLTMQPIPAHMEKYNLSHAYPLVSAMPLLEATSGHPLDFQSLTSKSISYNRSTQ